MMRVIWSILLLSLLAVGTSHTQLIQTPSGPLEFVGLRRWTSDSLWQAIYRSAPGQGAHACAAVLKDRFGFADASVLAYPLGDSAIYWVVTVIEPEDSLRVRYRSTPVQAEPTLRGWAPVARILRRGSSVLSIALQSYDLVVSGKVDSARAKALWLIELMHQRNRPDPGVEEVQVVWDLLKAHSNAVEKERALRMLQSDGNDTNRACAAAMLINFSDDDAVWCALMDAQIDQSSFVQVTAAEVLEVLRSSSARTVDWSASAASIRLILNGTNLFAFAPAVATLNATGVSPALAGQLLKDNHDLVLAKVAALHEGERDQAKALLVGLSGEDFGYDRRKWKSWINQLP